MHDPEQLEELIYTAIRKVKPSLQAIPLAPETRLANMGLASLERAIVVFELEDACEVSIMDRNLDAFDTVAEARDLLIKLLAEKDSGDLSQGAA
jgi:acyl carrier protein